MGRPPIGKRAMSGAERMRRHRARFHSGPVTVTIPIAEAEGIVALVEKLTQRIAEFEDECDKSDEAAARSARRARGGIQFSATLYEMLCAFAAATKRRARRSAKRAPRRSK